MVTHVAVMSQNAQATVENLRKDEDLARKLVNNAQTVHDLFLCADCIIDYLQTVLRAVADHYSLDQAFKNYKLPTYEERVSEQRLSEQRVYEQRAFEQRLYEQRGQEHHQAELRALRDEQRDQIRNRIRNEMRNVLREELRDELLNDITSGTRNLVEVRFGATDDVEDTDRSKTFLSYFFVRQVQAQGGRLQPTGSWELSDWKPGKGA